GGARMRITRLSTLTLLASLAALPSLNAACGDDSLAQVTSGDVAVSRENIEFQQTQLNRSTNTQIAIVNNGDGDLIVNNIEIRNASPYIRFSQQSLRDLSVEYDWRQGSTAQSWESHPGFPIRPLSELQIDLEFQPSSTNLECPASNVAPRCGELVIATNDRDTPTLTIPIRLNQSSGSVDVTPTVIDFPGLDGGPYDGSFTVTNRGAGDLTVTDVLFPNIAGLTFQEASNRQAPYSLAPSANSTYNLEFQPDGVTEYCGTEWQPGDICTLGSVTVLSDDSQGQTETVTLRIGGGSTPDIDVDPTALEFDVTPGSSETLTVDVGNTGGASLNYSVRIEPASVRDLFAIEVSGTALSAAGASAPAVLPGNEAALEITLTPDSEDAIAADLIIDAPSDPDEPQVVVDLYNGAPIAEAVAEPTSLVLPDVEPENSSTRQFTLSNLGRGTFNIATATFSGGAASEFSLGTNLAGESIAPGGRLLVTVSYDRPAEDVDARDLATLTITGDNALGDITVSLTAVHDVDVLPPNAVINVTPSSSYVVGEEISFDASATTATTGELASNPFRWVISQAPGGSSATLSANSGTPVTLTPDVAGEYRVLLTATAVESNGSEEASAQVETSVAVQAQ
ncbi:MAG: choice-of-anchor D domain-containing protein, partial [Myxococcales bacterium]|nr:choice-of-anchor D domain-containing protein [Myxococcales bacterium]